MLARSGRLPSSGDYAYEVKWDGFRAIVSTEEALRVRSRRGWDMTPHVGFLADLPVHAVLDGELVALDDDGKPDFPRVCECLLQRRSSIPLTYMVFDVLSVEGESVASQPYTRRRVVLGDLQLDGAQWRTPEAFDDGEALWVAVCEHELEGVVREAAPRPLRAGRARLDQDEEPRLLALGAGARGRVEDPPRAAVRLGASSTPQPEENSSLGTARRHCTDAARLLHWATE